MEGSGEYFAGGRKWRIATEKTGEVKDGPATVRFLQGTFTIEGGKFSAPGSSARGSKGVLLQEVGPDGQDIDGSQIAIGLVTLRQARKAGAVAPGTQVKLESR